VREREAQKEGAREGEREQIQIRKKEQEK